MVATDPRDAGFRAAESEILPDYQPLSRLAVASLVAALLSPTALAHPLLWIVPAVTVLLAGLALRSIGRSEGELRGGGLARWSLATALLFICWAVAWNASHQYLIGRHARHYSQAWFDLIQKGRLYDAHQLMLPFEMRAPVSDSLEETYAKAAQPSSRPKTEGQDQDPTADPVRLQMEELSSGYKSFTSDRPMNQLLGLKTDWQAEFRRNLRHNRLDQYKDEVDQQYSIRYTENGEPRSFDVVVSVERTSVDKVAQWRVSRIQHPEDYRRYNQ